MFNLDVLCGRKTVQRNLETATFNSINITEIISPPVEFA